ncbi:MAG: response regulator [Pseudomonadota bacterium]
MNDLDTFLHSQTPTALRPLLGLTVLLVEDSLTACEAIRLMCLRSGARIRRADCLESAHRHLGIYRPSMLITDMCLPDGSGADLITDVIQMTPTIDVILGLSADPTQRAAAETAGAHGFIEKPIQSIAEFQTALLQYLPQSRQPKGPRKLNDTPVAADTLALQEDLAHALNLLEDGDNTPATHSYLATFLSGVAQTASDADLEAVARAYALARDQGEAGPKSAQKAKLSAVLIDRLAQKTAI